MAGHQIEGQEAIAVIPGRPGFLRIGRRLEEPGSRSVRCRVEAVGCCITDRIVMRGLFGAPPRGQRDLVVGHEVVVRVEDVPGDEVEGTAPGLLAILRVREPESGAPDWVRARPDLADRHFVERGLLGLDGGLRRRLVCEDRSLVPLPSVPDPAVLVLVEPAACVCKALRLLVACRQALLGPVEEFLPPRAVVLGAGSCGLLATAWLRLEGYEVVTLDLLDEEALRARLVRQVGGHYQRNEPTRAGFLDTLHREHGPFRLVFDTTGEPAEVDRFEAVLGPTGVMGEFGVPDGRRPATVDLRDATVRRIMGTRARLGSVNAGPEDWPVAIQLVGAMQEHWPELIETCLRRIDGLDLEAMVAAIEDPEVVKPVVLPHGR